MTPEMTLPLTDPRATLEAVGGKGASLARLSRAGLPVPDGFHITTTAYQQFVSTNQLQPRIQACLALVDPDQYASLETAAQAIQALFLQSLIPQDIQDAIAQAYAALPGEQPQIAVRSSATAEDLPDLSFAGQHETYLNIHGLANVLDAVKRCWASLWTARAIGYRLQHKVAADSIRLAVAVQMLVPAQAAGVMFTANPANGQCDHLMITAAWGLGEAVVSGLVTPDTLIVAKPEGKLLSRQTAHKETMTVLCENGTAEQFVPETMRDSPVLSGPEALALARFGARIEALYAMPMDIEWALAEGKIAILQARPITPLTEPQLAPPTEWPLPDPKGKYIRASILDLLPDPLTPLFATLGGGIIEATTRRLYAWLIGAEDLKLKLFDTINDYGYMNTNLGGWMMLRMGLRSLFRIKWMFTTAQSRLEAARLHYRQVIRQWQVKPLAELRAVELLDAVRQLTAEMAQIYTVLQSGPLPAASVSEAMFAQVYNRLIKKKGDPEPLVYLLGFVSLPIQAELALYDLAQWAGGMNSLSTHLTTAPSSRLAAELNSQNIPTGVVAKQWVEWRQRFKTHLASYGHLTYNLDFANAVAADDPAPLLETCRLYLMGKASSPQARVQTLKAHREQAVQALQGRLHGLKRGLFDKLLRSAQLNAPRREDGFADLGLGYPLLRRMLCELGRRLVQAGALAQPAGVYWLTALEADAAAAALDQAQPLPALWAAVHHRRGVWKAEQRALPPVTLPIGVKILGLNVEKFTTPSASPGQEVIKGFGVSQGQVTAPACVLRGPEDFAKMRPGDVLVAPITTPAWTPLFALASAIVTDIGGPLSHSSIVAREYGIPAVLGTLVATRRIITSQMISVDGGAGTVKLVAAHPHPPDASSTRRAAP